MSARTYEAFAWLFLLIAVLATFVERGVGATFGALAVAAIFRAAGDILKVLGK